MVNKDIAILMLVSLLCSIVWMASSIYVAYTNTTLTELDQIVMRPIEVKELDLELINNLPEYIKDENIK